jgi:putative hemolysin
LAGIGRDTCSAAPSRVDPTPGSSRAAIVEREDGSLLMDVMLAVDEVKRALGVDSLPDDGSYHTLAGFILAQLGRVPRESDAVAYGGWCSRWSTWTAGASTRCWCAV